MKSNVVSTFDYNLLLNKPSRTHRWSGNPTFMIPIANLIVSDLFGSLY